MLQFFLNWSYVVTKIILKKIQKKNIIPVDANCSLKPLKATEKSEWNLKIISLPVDVIGSGN